MPLALYCFDYLSSSVLNSISFFPYYITDLVIMVFPSIKFIESILYMIRTKKSQFYSFYTVSVLLISHSLKILLFIFTRYSIVVFGQSIFQLLVPFILTFLKFYYEEPPNNFPFMSQNINLTFTNRIKWFDLSTLSRLFHFNRTRNFTEFFFSFLLYAIFGSGIFILFYFVICRKFTIRFIGIFANLLESTVMIPTFQRILIIQKNNEISFLYIFQFLLCDVLQFLLLLYCKAPKLFIVGISIQICFDLIFVVTFSAFNYFPRKIDENQTNLLNREVDSPSASSTASDSGSRKSSYSILQSDSEKTVKSSISDLSKVPS